MQTAAEGAAAEAVSLPDLTVEESCHLVLIQMKDTDLVQTGELPVNIKNK